MIGFETPTYAVPPICYCPWFSVIVSVAFWFDLFSELARHASANNSPFQACPSPSSLPFLLSNSQGETDFGWDGQTPTPFHSF